MGLHRRLAVKLFRQVDKARQIGLQRRRVAAQLGAKGAIGFFLPQPVLRPCAHQFHPVLFTGFLKLIKQVVLHFNRVMQLPTQLSGIGHADRPYRTHAQLDITHGQPGEPLVGQYRFGIAVLDDLVQHIARFRTSDGEDTPLRGHIIAFDITKLGCLILNRLAQIITVIGRPSPGAYKVIFILCNPHDGIFRACGARTGQRIGQVDAANRRQFVTGEPVKECRCTGSFNHMFGECGRINQANTFAHCLGFVHRVLPPTAPAEGACIVVVEPLRREIVRTFPAVDPTKLCTTRGLTVIGG